MFMNEIQDAPAINDVTRIKNFTIGFLKHFKQGRRK